MLSAMTGPNHGLRAAWLMGRASYAYTRSFDGAQMSDDPDDVIRFGRWYALKEAVTCAWRYLKAKP